MIDRDYGTVVLGVGNPLMGDDGLGIHAVGALKAAYETDETVGFIDGGTWGMSLLHVVEASQRLLILDAIAVGRAPGTLVVLERDEVPRMFAATKLSPHQVDLRDVLALAELRGRLPEDTVALGIQPARIALGTELSVWVANRLPELLDCVQARLEHWGHAAPVMPEELTCTS